MITTIVTGLGLDLATGMGAAVACRRALRLLRTIPGCCPRCHGTGGDLYDESTGGRCWDCQATGHPHLGLCMWGSR